jgi:molybdate transport system substrate-binding protein
VRQLLAALALLTTVTACSSSGRAATPGLDGTIVVAAASSLTGTFDTLAQRFEGQHAGVSVKLDFGGSPTLATQIDEGAPVDVFASASTKDMRAVVTAGNASEPVTFARNRAEIAVPAGNPAGVHSLADLARPGVRVALCEASVPCGAVADTVLANGKVEVKPVTRQPDVKATLSVVSSGEVDAGIVYVTDVLAAGSKVDGVAIPAADNAATDYPIAVCTHSRNPAIAQAFVEYVRSTAGRSVLSAAGFAPP